MNETRRGTTDKTVETHFPSRREETPWDTGSPPRTGLDRILIVALLQFPFSGPGEERHSLSYSNVTGGGDGRGKSRGPRTKRFPMGRSGSRSPPSTSSLPPSPTTSPTSIQTKSSVPVKGWDWNGPEGRTKEKRKQRRDPYH